MGELIRPIVLADFISFTVFLIWYFRVPENSHEGVSVIQSTADLTSRSGPYDALVEQFHRNFPSGQVPRFGGQRPRMMRFQPGNFFYTFELIDLYRLIISLTLIWPNVIFQWQLGWEIPTARGEVKIRIWNGENFVTTTQIRDRLKSNSGNFCSTYSR